VKEGFVDAGFVRDLLHAGAGRAAPDEHGARGVEDAFLGIPVDRAFTAWFSHMVSPTG
jgi:hypothetical protein